MKDLLNYYYYIITDKIHMHNNEYYFTYKNNYFCLYKYLGNIDDINLLFQLNCYMLLNNYEINRIILNKDSNILTKKENNYYCLVLINNNNENKIRLQDIIKFQRKNNLNILNRSNWYFLWTRKVDSIEYTMKHLKHKYKLIYYSLSYYIGLTENAISYLKYLNIKNNNLSICHNRVLENFNYIDLYNPLNLIIDYKVRDLAEYFKSAFFNKKMETKEIVDNLKRIKMNNIDYIYFYIRLLYPSYYFDLYDKVLNGIVKEDKIIYITKLSSEYEYLLYQVYLVIKNQVNIIGIEWINRKFAN